MARDVIYGTPQNQAAGAPPFTQTWSFAIPNQTYVVNNGIDFPSQWDFSTQQSPTSGDVDTFSTPSSGTWSPGQALPVTLTAAQIADINAAANGTLTTTFSVTLSNYVTVFWVRLQLARSSGPPSHRRVWMAEY